jgi:hypothetical protein
MEVLLGEDLLRKQAEQHQQIACTRDTVSRYYACSKPGCVNGQ